MLWIPGGLRQVIIRNFQFEPCQFEEMFKTKILQNKGDDGRLPVDHPRGHGDEDEDCSEGQPTPASRKQHRLEPLISCRKPFIRIYIHICVFACNPFFITNLSFANINPLSNNLIEQ